MHPYGAVTQRLPARTAAACTRTDKSLKLSRFSAQRPTHYFDLKK
jgi:hypothetical protein